ncbi:MULTISPECIES: DUF1372 family protein [Bacteria]|uniref:DUF1372 family protein n=2 Tax=cellular organisms TaxID=131567 RepID=UPI00195FE5F6|nr:MULTISPECIES: DUF1372 family protein [Bacteria]
MVFTSIKTEGKTKLEIRLSDDQLEHVANDGSITFDTSQPMICDKITISQLLVKDVTSPIVRRDRTLISRRDLAIKDIACDSSQMGVRLGGQMTKREWFIEIAKIALLLSSVLLLMVVIYSQGYNTAKSEMQRPIIHVVDNAGGVMVGEITDKEIIEGRYTVTAGAYGKFLVTKEQYESLKVGDPIPEFLKGREE